VKRKVEFQGKEVWGEEVDFEIERENWNTYILHDGTKLKMKSVVAKVTRLDLFKNDGEPIYLVNASNIVAADVPDTLKRKPE
jgi:hypothetical protein